MIFDSNDKRENENFKRIISTTIKLLYIKGENVHLMQTKPLSVNSIENLPLLIYRSTAPGYYKRLIQYTQRLYAQKRVMNFKGDILLLFNKFIMYTQHITPIQTRQFFFRGGHQASITLKSGYMVKGC